MNAAALPKGPANDKTTHTERPTELRIVPRSAFSDVTDLMLGAVQEGVFPGAVLSICKNGQEVYNQAVGYRCMETADNQSPAATTSDLVYDIGSLTQQLVTSTLIMRLVEQGCIKLEDRLVRHLQSFSVQDKSAVNVAHLLSHCSGLAAWHPYYEDVYKHNSTGRMGLIGSKGAKDFVYNALVRESLKYKTGTKEVYSDLGFIVLGNLIENLTGLDLSRAAQRYIVSPLKLKSTSYVDLAQMRHRGIQPVVDLIAPTEECDFREKTLCGEVHDENAWVMGGIAGHAGIFTTAQDLNVFANELLRAWYGKSEYMQAQTVRTFWQVTPYVSGASWGLGWQHASESNDLLGCGFSNSAVGHNSFTGCSLWIDPERGFTIVLMSNRINPSRNNKKITDFRKILFASISRALS